MGSTATGTKRTLLEAIVDCVPQWYEGSHGTYKYELSCENETLEFYSHRRLTPKLSKIFQHINENADQWLSELPDYLTPGSLKLVRERILLEWLALHNSSVRWEKLLAYAELIRLRTYENQPVSTNLIIDPVTGGGQDIDDATIQKILDPLASGMNTFFRVTKDAGFSSYEQISLLKLVEPDKFKLYPDFLHPLVSAMEKSEFSLHITTKRDVIVCNNNAMIAALRRECWYIYDSLTFKNSLVDIISNYEVACNMYDLLFDLSYRRHGALLVYDPDYKVAGNIVNSGSLLASSSPSKAHSMLKDSVQHISLGCKTYSQRQKNILFELASMDGAVIFDKEKILAFGAMIRTHDNANQFAGARTTAANSAYLFGGKPAKISSDGEISILFKARDTKGNSSKETLVFG
jgi:hypothetical protein